MKFIASYDLPYLGRYSIVEINKNGKSHFCIYDEEGFIEDAESEHLSSTQMILEKIILNDISISLIELQEEIANLERLRNQESKDVNWIEKFKENPQ